MTDAVIVSTARTGLAKSWRGALNMTHGATMGGHVVQAAVERARLDPAEVEDVLMGCALPEGATGGNIARQIALRAGLPVTAAGMTVNRFCSSGLQTIAHGGAARRSPARATVFVAGGVESISCVQNETNKHMIREAWLPSTSPRSTGRCCRPRRRSPSATTSRASGRTSTARRASSARRRRGGGQVQRRDRADHGDHGRGRQGVGAAASRRRSRSQPTKASAPTRPTRAWRRSSRRCPAA